jgi:hypothetical protein
VLKEIGGGDNLNLAAMCLERALVVDGQTIANTDPEHAKRLSNLATILSQIGGDERLRRAEHCQTEALRLDLQIFGRDQPQTALNLLALSEILRERNHVDGLAEAGEMVNEAIRILHATLGPEHSWTGRASTRDGGSTPRSMSSSQPSL